MKKTVTLALTLALVLGLLSGCANNDTPADNAENSKAAETAENFTDEMKIPYAVDLSPEDGADSVERSGDHENSPYFVHPDVYNMESTDTLTVLTHFRTMQQTSEWSCGVTAALMVLDWYDALGDWNEESLAALRHSLDGTELEGYPGATLNQAIDIFNGVGGFDIISSNDYPDGIWLDDIQGWLSEGKPVMICWNDWGGHWQTIIGYDTMGTENENDDVFLVADSYDTTDHNQDGYGIYPAERLMYNFTMYGAFPESEGWQRHAVSCRLSQREITIQTQQKQQAVGLLLFSFHLLSANFDKQELSIPHGDFRGLSGQDLVAHAVLVFARDLRAVERVLRIADRNPPRTARDIEQREKRVLILDGDFVLRDDLHLRIVVHDLRLFAERIKVEQDRHVSERVVEPRADDADEQKVVIPALHHRLDGKHRVGVVLFTREHDGLYIEVRIAVRVKVADDQRGLHPQRLHVLEAAVAEDDRIVRSQILLHARIVADVRAADDHAAFFLAHCLISHAICQKAIS